jgi:hypothetical protein
LNSKNNGLSEFELKNNGFSEFKLKINSFLNLKNALYPSPTHDFKTFSSFPSYYSSSSSFFHALAHHDNNNNMQYLFELNSREG